MLKGAELILAPNACPMEINRLSALRTRAYDDAKLEELMQDAGIIRNRQKLKAAITNAQAFLKVQKEFGTFDKYIWSFTNGQVIDHHFSR